MKNLVFISLAMILGFIACTATKKNLESKSSALGKKQSTYAEISVKEGGEWKDRKYVGGTFKNIQSLKVPAQHTDHSFYIRYEGPGWENNNIGYRLYLDWRNAIDIFGKVTDSLILRKVGQDGFDSYHSMNSWGMDILKAGKGLGIGAIGRYHENKVLHFNEVDSTFASVNNFPDKSIVDIKYYGWKTINEKVDLTSQLSIEPNKRFTKHTIQFSENIQGICTGIVNLKQELVKKESQNKKWAYLATYGLQSLVPDQMGMAVFYQTKDVENVTDSEFDHLLVFKPTTNQITFYFLGAWEKEKNGIKKREDFIKYIDGLLIELNKNNKI